MNQEKNKNYYYIFFTLLLIGFIKILIGLNLPVQADETYWWALSRQLDFSYFDQGPMAPIHIRIFTSLFGDTALALKLAAVSSTTIGNFLVYLTARELGMSLQKAWISMLLSIIIPGFFLGSFVIVHDSSFVPIWLSALYFSIRYLKREESRSLLFFFISLGFGALSKHLMIFFVIGVLLWFLLTPQKWPLLKKPLLYLGIILTFIIIAPMLYWNYLRDWVGLEMLLGMKYAGGGSRRGDTFNFLLGQLLTFSPVLFISFWMIPFGIGSGHFKESRDDPVWKFIYINATILPISLFFISFKTTIQPNWTFASFPAMILILTESVFKSMDRKQDIIKICIASLPAFLEICIVLFFYEFRDSLRLEDRFQLVHRNFGYEDAIQKIEKFRRDTDPDSVLLANTYQDASRASWYIEGHPFIPSLNLFKRNQYTLWEQPVPGKNYVVFHVSDNPCIKPDLLSLYLRFACSSVSEYPEEVVVRNDRIVKRYQYWYCKNLEDHWNENFVNIYFEDSLKKFSEDYKKNQDSKAKYSFNKEDISRLLFDFRSETCTGKE